VEAVCVLLEHTLYNINRSVMRGRGQNILFGGYNPSHGEHGSVLTGAYDGGSEGSAPVGSIGQGPKAPEAESNLKTK